MKPSNIKTREQFDEYAEVWYQRSHNLRRVWQNPEESQERRDKAKELWYICYKKVRICFKYALKLSTYNPTMK